MLSNYRLKLTAHLANFLSARNLAGALGARETLGGARLGQEEFIGFAVSDVEEK